MLDERGAVEHLVARGLVAADLELAAAPLRGGVSNDAIAVHGPGLHVVVKRPLARLRVEEEWTASELRVVTEGRALRLAAALTPDRVPSVRDLDTETRTLVLEHAPPSWRTWRDDLLAGHAEPDIGRALGAALRTWHERTAAPAATLAPFNDTSAFVQLRIDPFHRAVAERHPRVAPQIEHVVERLLTSRRCLVHGDFSPKNVLVGGAGVWVIDWEVAHVGDPAFDLAFLLAHLLLKSAQRPDARSAFRAVAEAFLASYGDHDADAVVGNVGCLLLARVDGKSPAGYLSPEAAAVVRAAGFDLLATPPRLALAGWERLNG